jgi:hypothetical protein
MKNKQRSTGEVRQLNAVFLCLLMPALSSAAKPTGNRIERSLSRRDSDFFRLGLSR